MIKSFLTGRLGIGKIPEHEKVILEDEGIQFINEGISGSVTHYHFKAKDKYFSNKKQGFFGAFAITKRRLIGFGFGKRLINIPLDHPRFQELHFLMDRKGTLIIVYDAHLIDPEKSGTVEIRFKVSSGEALTDLLEIEQMET